MARETEPRENCPQCEAVKGDVSRPNLVTYPDGNKQCQACGYFKPKIKKETTIVSDLVAGVVTELAERGISLETCQKYNIRTAEYTGYVGNVKVEKEIIKIFPCYDNGKVIRQKIKSKRDKHIQGQVGNTKKQVLFGQHCFTPSKERPLIVHEGEEDAAAMWQMTGLPSVSGCDGAGNLVKYLEANMEWVSGFREVLMCTDHDAPGNKAFEQCNELFEPGFCKRIRFPLGDANDMLLAGRTAEAKAATWAAEVVRPSTIVFPSEIRDKVLTKPQYGTPFPWHSMTKATYGMRLGEVYLLAAATSVGKTEVIREIISGLLSNECKIGLFSFEQQPEQTMQRFIASTLNSRIYLPGCEGWDDEKIKEELDKLGQNIALYRPQSGHVTVDSVLINIRFLAKAHGMTFFVIDNLKALSSNPVIDGKRVAAHEYASHAMSQFVRIAKQLNVNIFVVNHLAGDKISLQAYVSTSPKNEEKYLSMGAEELNNYVTRPGLSWETGRMPGIENIFGGGAIKDLADYILVLARNRMSKDEEEHRTIRVKFLKTRMDSSFEGFEFKLKYNYNTGRLTEDFTQECHNREDTPYFDLMEQEAADSILK